MLSICCDCACPKSTQGGKNICQDYLVHDISALIGCISMKRSFTVVNLWIIDYFIHFTSYWK